MKNKSGKGAFTLAEVLITLAIIGVVAALTIPTVVRNYKERQTVTVLKKAFSQLNSAFNLAIVDKGPIDSWDWGVESDGPSAVKIVDEYLAPHLKIIKNCGNGEGCAYGGDYKMLSGGYTSVSGAARRDVGKMSSFAHFVLADGMTINFHTHGLTNGKFCNHNRSLTNTKPYNAICGQIQVDVNGPKAPNKWGEDYFAFYITKYGVHPWGGKGDIYLFNTYCKYKNTDVHNGLSCGAWVLKNENLDYLHRDVSAEW